MKRLFKALARWWRGGDAYYAVEYDSNRFDTPATAKIQGLAAARRFARRWCRRHPHGRADLHLKPITK